MKDRFETACSAPKMSSARYSPSFTMSVPPNNAPTMVAASPMPLFTYPTSSSEKPAPRNRNAVVSEPAKASPSL